MPSRQNWATSPNLEDLFLGNNQLTGAIPPELGNLTKLHVVNLGGNKFSNCLDRELLPSLMKGLTPGAHCEDENDRQALIAFFNATGGPDWANNENWLTDKNIAEWHGVHIDNWEGRVTQLYLVDNQLTGSIPARTGQAALPRRTLSQR